MESVDDQFNKLSKEISRIDLEQSDLLHIVENRLYDKDKMGDVVLQLQKVRLRRRELKNKMKIVSVLRDFKKTVDKSAAKKTLCVIDKIEKEIKHPVYTTKIISEREYKKIFE
jgi:hypothetical protein